MLEISYTSSADARNCWKRYYYRVILGLSPKKVSRAINVGSVVHPCFEMYFNGASKEEIDKYIHTTFDKAIQGTLDPVEVENMIVDKYTVLGMWHNYPFNEMEFTKCFPEKKFKVRLANLRGVRLTGRVDGLVIRTDKWWVREVKTTSLDRRAFQSRASVSYQAAGYIYGIEKQEDIKIQGIVYDTIKRPLLRKGTSEKTEDFAKRIYADYSKDDKKKLYYERFYSYRSAKEISEYEIDMVKLAREMRSRIRHNDWFRNTDNCYSYNSECPYKKICWEDKPDQELISTLYERRKEREEQTERRVNG